MNLFNTDPISCDDFHDLEYFLIEKGDIERWCGFETFCNNRPDIGIILKVFVEFIKLGIVGDRALVGYIASLEPNKCKCHEERNWCPRD
jgi:hypothetical protein